MIERPEAADRWDATRVGAQKQLLKSSLAAAPAQRLAWMEEMPEIVHRAGALGKRPLESK